MEVGFQRLPGLGVVTSQRRGWEAASKGKGKGKGGIARPLCIFACTALRALPQLPGVRGDTQSVGPNMTITQGIAHSLLQHTTFVLQNKMQKYA